MNHADKLFRPFARLHPDSEFSGTGIGLATVQRVVARHGGRVTAQGDVGRGATFSFMLEGTGRHDERGAASHPARRGQSRRCRADDPCSRALPVSAACSRSLWIAPALELRIGELATGFAFVMRDLKLPKVSRPEVLERVRANAPTGTLPVIILTLCSEREDIIESYNSAANSYIRKPVDSDEVRSRRGSTRTYGQC